MAVLLRSGTRRDLAPSPLDAALAVGAAARVTRFLVTDHLGEWLLVGPIRRRAERAENAAMADLAAAVAAADGRDPDAVRRLAEVHERPLTLPAKIVVGLDCPHCVSVWAAALVAAGYLVLPRPLWRWGTGLLGVAYVTGHLAGRADSGA